ncbi:MAG: thiamine diphosphokinase [Oscillospiraceae bacterium]|jgi:thiamine pyrophosphokinase
MAQPHTTAVIIASRPVVAGMRRYVPSDAFIIAADAGWKNAEALGLPIHLAVGDFDSAAAPKGAQELLRLPAEKDDTDTHFAAKQAVLRGFKSALMLGCMGGRADHTHANLQTLLYLAQNGLSARMEEPGCTVHCFGPGAHRLPAEAGRWLSVFAAGGPARGVTLSGVKYPLHAATLEPNTPLGVSNAFVEPRAHIACETGWLYVYTTEET